MKNEKLHAVVINYISVFVVNIANLIYIPLMLKRLGNSEYGLYSLASSLVEYVALFNFGYGNAYIRYHAKLVAQNDDEKVKILNGIMMEIYLILGGIVLVAGTIMIINAERIIGNKINADSIPLFKLLLVVMIMTLSINMPYGLMNSVVVSNERYVFYQLMMFAKNICPIIFSTIFLAVGYGSLAIAIVMLVVNVFLFIGTLVYCLVALHFRITWARLNGEFFRDIGLYSVFIMIQSIIDCINWNTDKLILARINGSVSIAYYTLGTKINSVVHSVTGAIHSVSVSHAHSLVANDESSQSLSIFFATIGKYQFMIMLYAITAFGIWGKDLLSFWVGEGYDESYWVTIFLLVPEIIYFSQSVGLELLRAMKKHAFLSICYLLICIINILISIPLSRQFGAPGAALGTCISGIIAWGVIANIYYYKVAKIDVLIYFREVTRIFIRMFPIMAVAIVAAKIQWKNAYTWIFQIAVYSLAYLFVGLRFCLTKEERLLIIKR